MNTYCEKEKEITIVVYNNISNELPSIQVVPNKIASEFSHIYEKCDFMIMTKLKWLELK